MIRERLQLGDMQEKLMQPIKQSTHLNLNVILQITDMYFDIVTSIREQRLISANPGWVIS